MHPLERLVQTRHQILAAAPFAVRTVPHAVTRLRRDKQLISVRTEIFIHQPTERLFRTTGRNTVVVRKIKMGDTVVERKTGDSAASLKWTFLSEIVPET